MCFQAFSAQTSNLKIIACNTCKSDFRRKCTPALAAAACRRCLKHIPRLAINTAFLCFTMKNFLCLSL